MSETMITKAARAAAVAAEQVRPSDEHDAEGWSYIARAVLMAVRSDENGIMNSWIDSGSMDDEHPARIFTILAQEPGA